MHKSHNSLNIQLLHTDFSELNDSWNYDNVFSPFSRIYLITKGEGWVWHSNKKYCLKPNHLYLIPKFTLSRYRCDQYLSQFYIHFLSEPDDKPEVFEAFSFQYEVEASPLDYELFDRLLKLNPEKNLKATNPKDYDNRSNLLSFNQPYETQNPQGFLESKGILLQLFSRFIVNSSPEKEKDIKLNHKIGSTVSHIHKNLKEKLTVEELAERVFLSPDYFSKCFMEVMGIRPIDYINNKRLERAQLLLTTTGKSMQEIAEEIGIPNLSYFSRLFKRKFGIPPARFRTQKWAI
ncbi:AraC family transcriptional regulator [Flexithrix dorotheae]|uniref:AraC family transcriptional regulator n=1 Tax=Flexithrix dorotheae TaxID=70993 RepID=UPI00037BD9B8|nr:response regulator transcription factor [Flexithrix dorotheae]